MTDPVLTDEATRRHHDEKWAAYPWEHPDAHWLRAEPRLGMICARCGGTVTNEKGDAEWSVFVETHLRCPLGLGFGASAPKDPLFEG